MSLRLPRPSSDSLSAVRSSSVSLAALQIRGCRHWWKHWETRHEGGKRRAKLPPKQTSLFLFAKNATSIANFNGHVSTTLRFLWQHYSRCECEGREGGSQDGGGESASFELVDPPTIRRAQTKIHGEQLPIPKRRSLLHCGRNARLET